MGAIAQLSTTDLDVVPGKTATLTVTIRNTGSVVDRFSLEAVGVSTSWVTFTTDSLSLFPEASGTVSVVFAPPKDPTSTAGPVPFGIRVASSEDPQESVVEEGTLNVAAFSDVTVDLVPRILEGRRSARGRIAVDNRSNCSFRAEVTASDPGSALGFGFSPTTVDIPSGGAVFIRMTVKPKSTFWRGPSTTKSIRVALNSSPLPPLVATAPAVSAEAGPAGEASEATPPAAAPASFNPHPASSTCDGSMIQKAVLPSWLVKALVAVLALAALAVLLWFAVLKPQIKSSAQSEVAKQLASDGVTPNGNTTTSPSGGSGSGSGGGGSTTATTVGGASSTGSATATSTGVTVNGTSQASGNGTRTIYTVPSGQVLQVTDLLVENSAGDTGTIAIAKNGNILMEWSLANFRDLDYHWIAPTIFNSGSKMEVIVNGCPNTCTPGIYYAGNLVKST